MKRFLGIVFCFIIIVVVPIGMLVSAYYLTTMGTVRVEERKSIPETWNAKEIAAKYAPVVYQGALPEKPTPVFWDYLCAFDFDGDWKADNNVESLESLKNGKDLKATVYYSLLESKTHFFIFYTLFYPAEWSYDEKLFKWSENNVRHIFVVVRKYHRDKAEGTLELAAIQRSDDKDYFIEFYKGHTKYLEEEAGTFKKNEETKLPFATVLLDESGNISEKGTHLAVFASSGHHEIYMPAEKPENFKSLSPLELKSGIAYFPSTLEKGEAPVDENTQNMQKVKYALVDFCDHVWSPKDKSERKAFFSDLTFSFEWQEQGLAISQIPIFFGGKQLEGAKTRFISPNITPFVFGKKVGNKDKNKGSFFFNPIASLRKYFNTHKNSLVYLHHPYIGVKEEKTEKK